MKIKIHRLVLSIIGIILGGYASAQAPTSTLTAGNYQNRTLYNDSIYLISGQVNIDSGFALTIEPGTIIKGIKNSANKAVLIIKRGARIIANGSPSQPIVFTSDQPAGARAAGDWGGVIICGRAPVNFPIGYGQVEGGLFGPAGLFGGNISNDNSGILRYVRIEFSGIAFASNNETNGITLAGVGSGTTIEYVQVSYCGDDGFEWFGGTVNCKNLVVYRTLDDDFDTDNGFSGNVQFGLAIRDPQVADNPSISTSEGFESDNNDAPANGVFSNYYTSPRTRAVFSNITSIGPRTASNGTLASGYRGVSNGDGGKGARIRRGSQLSILNSVFTGWGVGLFIDGTESASGQNSDSAEFKNNIFGHMTASNTTNAPFLLGSGAFATISNLRSWFAARNNDTTTLANLGLTGFELSNPMNKLLPVSGSRQLTGSSFNSNKLTNSFFTPVSYRGAFGSTDWTQGWTNWNPINADYTVTYQPTVQTVSGSISTNTTWTNDKIWKISGQVNVDSGYTLTIQPGTIIQGIKNSSNKAILIVRRGAKIIAEGTANRPIVFTSDQPAGARAAGDWGGVIICGRAPVNFPVGFGQVEGGLFGAAGLFGGNISDDNSGIFRFVRIEFPGIAFASNNETNGITLAGVGSGTTIENVQVSFCGDDGFEWFGGTVNCKNLIVYKTLDDDFDTDNGFSGTVQFALAIRDPQVADNPSVSTSEGFESDNNDAPTGGVFSSYYTAPRTRAVFSNVTSIGPRAAFDGTLASGYRGVSNGDGGKGARIRRGSQLSIFNSVFAGWGVGLFIDGAESASGQNSDSAEFRNNTMAHITANNSTNRPFLAGSGVFSTISAIRSWFGARANDTVTLSQVGLTGLDINNPISKLLPPTGAAQWSNFSFTSSTKLSANPNITPVNYKGAFGNTDWTAGWASFDPINNDYTNSTFVPVANAVLSVKAFVEGTYNASSGKQVPDSVTIKLYTTTAPFEMVQTYTTVLDSNGVGNVNVPSSELGKSFYVALSGRNSIETWSAKPVTIRNTFATPASDICFSCGSTNVYGENVKTTGTVSLIFSGDLNKDGLCDASDLADCSNNQTVIGYIPADVNYDGIVDNTDLSIVDNNVANIIQIIRPF